MFLLCLQGNADEDSGRSSQYTYIHAGVPLRILGPLDSIFTRALLRSRGGGEGGVIYYRIMSFSFVCNGKVIIFRFVFL